MRFRHQLSLASLVSILSFVLFIASPAGAQETMRARDLGVPFEGTPGSLNAITDVSGIRVAHTTLIEGSGALEVGVGPVRTDQDFLSQRPRQQGVPDVATSRTRPPLCSGTDTESKPDHPAHTRRQRQPTHHVRRDRTQRRRRLRRTGLVHRARPGRGPGGQHPRGRQTLPARHLVQLR